MTGSLGPGAVRTTIDVQSGKCILYRVRQRFDYIGMSILRTVKNNRETIPWSFLLVRVE